MVVIACRIRLSNSKVSIKSVLKIKDLLIRQLENPVLWSQTITAMSNQGIESFMEVGPGKVLQGLNKRINRQIPVSGIESIAQLEALNV